MRISNRTILFTLLAMLIVLAIAVQGPLQHQGSVEPGAGFTALLATGALVLLTVVYAIGTFALHASAKIKSLRNAAYVYLLVSYPFILVIVVDTLWQLKRGS